MEEDTTVSKETLDRLRHLEMSRAHLGDRLLDLEQEKIRIMGSLRLLEEEKNKVFMGIIKEYNLSEGAMFEIDRVTGKLGLVKGTSDSA